MGADKLIDVHSRLTVVPHKPTPAGKVHPLSFLDHMMQLHTIHNVYYFDTSSVKERSLLFEALRDSLCRALSIYPIFAGRLRKRDDGQWEIKCNDAGVRLYEATVSITLDECLNSIDPSLESELSRSETIPDYTMSPLAVVQMTDFSCGNLAIGLSLSHLVGDALCGTLLMKAWGETYRAAQILHPPFYHPPSLKPRPKKNTDVKSRDYYASTFLNPEEDASIKDYRTVCLSFSHDMVEKCIAEVQEGSCKFGPSSPSDVLAALLWVAIVKAQGKPIGEVANLSVCLEFRKIHLPPLPYGYVGSAIHFLGVSSEVGDLTSKDLSYATSLVNQNVAMTDTEEVRSVIDWLQEMENQGGGPYSKPVFFYSPQLTMIIWDHFFSYDVFFDFGKPRRVSYRVDPLRGEGQVLVLPTAEDNSSRNVMLTLPKDVMNRLLEDDELLRFLPNIKQQ